MVAQRLLWVWVVYQLLSWRGIAAEPPDALASPRQFRLKPGFRLELVASATLVNDPVALAFDADGRLFVLENGDPAGTADAKTGRIRLLEDSEGKGVYDVSSVYADKLDHPRALICYDGGVFVGSGADILFLKDQDGDGVAESRQAVFTGVGGSTNGLNGRIAFTAFTWGLDNRIHVGTAAAGGDNISCLTTRNTIQLPAGNFSFDPRGYALFPESGLAPTGLTFDDQGRKFVCSAGDHIVQIMYEVRYAGRNPFQPMPNPLFDASGEGPAMNVYGLTPAPRAAPFTAACGLTIYRGHGFPTAYLDDAFVADTAAGVVHHDKLRANGLEMVADRPLDEAQTEFLAARDADFQPVQVVNAPDGALYIADFNHGPGTRDSATGRGRIWRVTLANFKHPAPPHMQRTNTRMLVAMLAHPNGWYRDTAARLLYERQDKSAVTPLLRILANAQSQPLARVHALRALDGLRALTEEQVIRSLGDYDERVRGQALLLAEQFTGANGGISDSLWGPLSALAVDSSVQVRCQLAFTLGQFRHEGRVKLLADLLRQDPAGRWIQSAVLSSLSEGQGELFGLLARDSTSRDSDAGRAMLRLLARGVGAKNDPAEVRATLAGIAAIPDSPQAFELAQLLASGLQGAGGSLAKADPDGLLKPLCSRALQFMLDDSAAEAVRLDAAFLLGFTSYEDAGSSMLLVLNADETPALQAAAVDALARFDDARVATVLVQRWSLLKPAARTEAMTAWLARPERAMVLLAALQEQAIARNDLSPRQLQALLNYPDPSVRQQASKSLGGGQ